MARWHKEKWCPHLRRDAPTAKTVTTEQGLHRPHQCTWIPLFALTDPVIGTIMTSRCVVWHHQSLGQGIRSFATQDQQFTSFLPNEAVFSWGSIVQRDLHASPATSTPGARALQPSAMAGAADQAQVMKLSQAPAPPSGRPPDPNAARHRAPDDELFPRCRAPCASARHLVMTCLPALFISAVRRERQP